MTVFDHICQVGQAPAGILHESAAQGDLFSTSLKITADSAVASLVWQQWQKMMSWSSLSHILFCFLRDDYHFYNQLYNYCALAWQHGKQLHRYQAHPDVKFIHKIGKEVGSEIHSFKGILRFQEMKTGHLYAPFTPDYNITMAVSRHFQSRLQGEKWVIHDVKRDIAVFWDGNKIQPIDMDPEFAECAKRNDFTDWNADAEAVYRDLWLTFFDAIAIESRINPQLQRQFLPQRYWNYLTEKN